LKQTIKPAVINIALWIAFLLALASSIPHLAYTFGTLEPAGWSVLGWIPAIAVDAGLAALAYSIQQRKRAKRSARALWWGVAAFALISALANLYHAIAIGADGVATIKALTSIDPLQWIKAAVLSATLPGMVLYLGEIVSSDDATEIQKTEQDEQRARTREEREQQRQLMHEQNEAKRIELEATRLQLQAQAEQRAAMLEQQPTTQERTCSKCGRTFRNRQAYAAHKCTNGGDAATQGE
jgi:hypothetical protein